MSDMRDTLEAGRHPVNIGQLVMGLAFVGLAVVWSLIANDAVEGSDVRWLLPIPWVLAGAVGLVAAAVTTRRRHGAQHTGWVEPAAREPHGQREQREVEDAEEPQDREA
ncbi:hypothetical protein [Nocardioides lijunqiniae]|uniref:hypothetical protein n=1 Tax=Nocardioides lijunqiniae TaxID=2760832 RepID=UPI00187865F9|nr:hypothetical protein [Nocardioides lijunqiniae]